MGKHDDGKEHGLNLADESEGGEPITVRQTELGRQPRDDGGAYPDPVHELGDEVLGDRALLELWVAKAGKWVPCEFRTSPRGPFLDVGLDALADGVDLTGYTCEVVPGSGVWRKRLDVADRFRWRSDDLLAGLAVDRERLDQDGEVRE